MAEPQYINISALYLGSALMMTAILMSSQERSSPLALGLVYAGLISLKTTFALFVPLHLAAVIAARIWETRRWGPALGQGGLTAAWFVLFLSPWLIVHSCDLTLPLREGRNFRERQRTGISGRGMS